jgi:hypothetical protein
VVRQRRQQHQPRAPAGGRAARRAAPRAAPPLRVAPPPLLGQQLVGQQKV